VILGERDYVTKMWDSLHYRKLLGYFIMAKHLLQHKWNVLTLRNMHYMLTLTSTITLMLIALLTRN